MMISMELLAAPARRLWSRRIQHRSSLRNFAASFQLFYHRRIFSSTFLLICNKNPLYHHDFQCLKISVRWSITLLRKPCCRSKPPPRAWSSEGTRIPGPLIKRAHRAEHSDFRSFEFSLFLRKASWFSARQFLHPLSYFASQSAHCIPWNRAKTVQKPCTYSGTNEK